MASRFWVAQPISAIADNGSGKCRCTVSTTTGMTSGGTVYIANVTGTPLLGGSQVISNLTATTFDVTAVTFVATGTGGVHGPWDGVNTNNWSTTTGTTPTGATAVPTNADTVTFDGSSGGGTVTVAATINANSNTIVSLTCGAFTGTLDFSVNNPSLTMGSMSISGTGTRTIKMGSGTFTLTSTTTIWDAATTTGLTFQTGTSTIAFTNTNPGGLRTFAGGGQTYNNLTINASSGNIMDTRLTGVNTFTTLTVNPPNLIWVQAAQTITTLNLNGASLSSMVEYFVLEGTAATNTQTVTIANISYTAIGGLAWSGSPVANNSLDFGKNTGITINPPLVGGVGVIGS